MNYNYYALEQLARELHQERISASANRLQWLKARKAARNLKRGK